LVQSNDVGIHSLWYVDENPFGRFSVPRRLWSDPIPSDARSAQAVVTADVKNHVKEIWPHLGGESADITLALALRRLNDSYHRSRLEDRHIDYWTALEALFLRVDEGELRYRAALLTARFIGVDLADRLDLFEKIKKSYDLRSKIVHGASPPKKMDVPAMINWTAALLRRVLRRCVVEHQSPDLNRILRDLLA
jgi:hypothetical protein